MLVTAMRQFFCTRAAAHAEFARAPNLSIPCANGSLGRLEFT
jgi:hypothetical protein